MSKQQRTAFTLIELLVVIAIIGILAAILFPVFARARENARRASCQNNGKQIGLGIHQYIQDYDGYYPYGSNYATPATYWPEAIYPYIKSKQIFVCPSDPKGGQYVWASSLLGDNGQVFQSTDPAICYQSNVAVLINDAASNRPVHEARLTNSADVFLLWDLDMDANGDPQKKFFYRSDGPWRKAGGKHFNGDNYLFADGHVKWLAQTGVPTSDVRFTLH